MSEHRIILATRKWEKDIIEYLSLLFKRHWMPSHDLKHHTRVWQNACRFCRIAELKNRIKDYYFYEKLIIACFFHDTGLLENAGEIHGKLSRQICEKFLSMHSKKVQFDVLEVLAAIENHDNKKYEPFRAAEGLNVYNILSVADDIDAFGAIGSYRYMEIFLLRGYEQHIIPDRILNNAKCRYLNSKKVFENLSMDPKPLNLKYLVVNNLFANELYCNSAESLVRWVNSNIIKPKAEPETFISNFDTDHIDNLRILSFIDKFNLETMNYSSDNH